MHDSIYYALALAESGKDIFNDEIKELIDKINSVDFDSNARYGYWDDMTYKAILMQILMFFDPENPKIDLLVKDLYSVDFSSYYYSTQAKIQSFITFSQYLENLGQESQKQISIKYNINGKRGVFILLNRDIIKKRKFYISDLSLPDDNKLDLKFEVKDPDNTQNIYIDANLVTYPENPEDVIAGSNGVSVSRTLFAIENDNDQIKEITIPQNKLKLGKTYMVKLEIEFKNEQRDVSIEDYLPAGLKVLNEKFKTVSSDANMIRDWWNSFSHVEYKKDMVFASAEKVYGGDKMVLKYLVTPVVEGIFTYPPVSVFPMYQPTIEGHTGYKILNIIR